jgi:hypothetical protein
MGSAPLGEDARRLSQEHMSLDDFDEDDERPPICPACGVTMVSATLAAGAPPDAEWICLECEETAEPS